MVAPFDKYTCRIIAALSWTLVEFSLRVTRSNSWLYSRSMFIYSLVFFHTSQNKRNKLSTQLKNLCSSSMNIHINMGLQHIQSYISQNEPDGISIANKYSWKIESPSLTVHLQNYWIPQILVNNKNAQYFHLHVFFCSWSFSVTFHVFLTTNKCKLAILISNGSHSLKWINLNILYNQFATASLNMKRVWLLISSSCDSSTVQINLKINTWLKVTNHRL